MARILVADDSPDILDLVELKLGLLGHQVTCANDGAEALAALGHHAFDLVILDVAMPRLGGLDALAAIRTDAAARQMPVILMSAFSRQEDVERGLHAGADDYLTKPFSLADLSQRVQRLLQS